MSTSISFVRAHARRVTALKLDMKAATTLRDESIRRAYVDGETIAELSRATGLTRTMLYKIVEKEPNA